MPHAQAVTLAPSSADAPARPISTRSGSHIAGLTDRELLAGGVVGSGAVAATLVRLSLACTPAQWHNLMLYLP